MHSVVNSATGATTIPSLEIYMPIGLVWRDKSVPVELHNSAVLHTCYCVCIYCYRCAGVWKSGDKWQRIPRVCIQSNHRSIIHLRKSTHSILPRI